MIEFRTLGSLDLTGGDGASLSAVVAHPKRIALLTYLALATPRGFHRRDTLIGLFWPELDQEHARHALRQMLYALRQDLGDEAIVRRGDEGVALSDTHVWCDAVACEAAMDAGEHERALELYRGGLLRGLYVSEAPAFERWLEDERVWLRERAAGAAWRLAHEHIAGGRLVDAERTAQRALLLVATDESEVRRFIEALAGAGDRAAAVRFYDKLAQRLAEEYDIAPAAETAAVVDAVKRGDGSVGVEVNTKASAKRESAAVVATPMPVTRTTRRSWRRPALLGMVLVVVVGAVVVVGRSLNPTAAGEPDHPRTSIAVLPFQNLSGDGPHAYFAGGLHDEVLTQLAKVAALTVMGRTSVMGYAGTTKPLREIASELGVGSVIEASVQVLGDRLRVNVQLLDAETGGQFWAERYDRTLDDAFAIQSDVAQRVVVAVGATLGGSEQQSLAEAPTANAEAYRLYLQGQEYYRRPGYERQNWGSALQLYERALVLDSTFALAHAALSLTHGWGSWQRYDTSPERLARQREEAETALRLAPDLPQAHIAMGRAHYVGRQDWQAALEEYRIALQDLPNGAELWGLIGYTHRRLGDWDEVDAAFEKATQLDPRDANLFFDLGGYTYQMTRRYADAIAAYNQALTLAPDFRRAVLGKGWVYLLWKGELDTLRAVLEQLPPEQARRTRVELLLWERNPDSLLALLGTARDAVFEGQLSFRPTSLYAGWAHELRGDEVAAHAAFDSARLLLDSVLAALPDDWRVHAARGLALAGLGRRQEALREARWLQQSVVYREDANFGQFVVEGRAWILAQAGAVDAALDEIEQDLAGPGRLSVHTLRLDPRWDPIRSHPRFRALLEKYGN